MYDTIWLIDKDNITLTEIEGGFVDNTTLLNFWLPIKSNGEGMYMYCTTKDIAVDELYHVMIERLSQIVRLMDSLRKQR
jgi:hypothetical protein